VQRGLAAGRGNGAHPTFQRRHAFLEHGVRGVADAAVDVARTLHVEQRGGVVAAVEDEAGAQVDGRGPCTCGWVWGGPSVQCQGVESGVSGSGHEQASNQGETG